MERVTPFATNFATDLEKQMMEKLHQKQRAKHCNLQSRGTLQPAASLVLQVRTPLEG